jgi:hypothetical protein
MMISACGGPQFPAHPAGERALFKRYEAQLQTSYQSVNQPPQCHQKGRGLPFDAVGHVEYGARGASQVYWVYLVR